MNADPTKPEVGYAQGYFAVQTRRQEIQDQLTDEQRRLLLRERVIDANKNLAGAAKSAGVIRYGIFQDAGYKGLYGGLGLQAIKIRKGLKKSDDLLDRAGRAELAANEFRATQTEQKLSRERIKGEEAAIRVHRKIGETVRATIKKIGGTMPEDLPAEPSIKKLIKQKAKQLNQPDPLDINPTSANEPEQSS